MIRGVGRMSQAAVNHVGDVVAACGSMKPSGTGMGINFRKECGKRTGVLTLKSGAIVKTPALCIPAKLMAVPHLTRDMFEQVLEKERTIMEVYYEDMWEHPRVIRALPMPFKKYANLEGYPVFLALREDRYFCNLDGFNLLNGDAFVNAVNRAGVIELKMEDLVLMMDKLETDGCIVPVDHYPLPGSAKRIKRSIERSVKYATAILSSRPEHAIPSHVSSNSGNDLSKIGNDSAVIAISGNSINDVPDALATLPDNPEQCRYLRGRLDIEGIRKALGSGKVDLIDAGIAIELAEAGKAILLPDGNFDPMTVQIEIMDLKRTEYKEDTEKVCSSACGCPTGQFMRAYLHHLFVVKEMLGPAALVAHNLRALSRFTTAFH